MPSKLPNPELMRELLRYEADTGHIFWREWPIEMFTDGKQSAEHKRNKLNSTIAGKRAFRAKHGTIANNGSQYRHGLILRRSFLAHRVAWVLHYGEWPAKNIDHINGDRGDNRIGNLRLADHHENLWNVGKHPNNTSGYKGVGWSASNNAWKARIAVKGKRIFLGHFKDKQEAYDAYCAAAEKYHGAFANIGG
jgi:hypothetical protein